MLIQQGERRYARLATAISMILAGMQVNAQDARRQELEEVLVTGSFIRGTPEDSAMPVEVMTFEELQNMGRPSNLDLIKMMSESGGVAGENNRVNFYPIGAQTINLRSLGARFTTVVFNGRRFPEQFSVNTGRFNNVAWIPSAAIGSIETLKAGGGVTYGSDAVAGVVNYVTRKGFEGLEFNADYRYIEDSDGDYNADILWGKNLGAAGDLLISLGYQHRSTLRTIDRDWSRYHYLENPQSWQSLTSSISNPGTMVFQRQVAGVGMTSFTPTQVTSELHMSAGGSIRDVGCAELGGFPGWTATPTPGCFTDTSEMEELVSEQSSYTLYLEHNVEAGGIRFHTEGLVYRQDLPNIALAGTFVNNPAAWPLESNLPGARQQNVSGTTAYFVPGYHPAVRNLLENDLVNSNGTLAFTEAQRNAIINTGRVGLLNFLWKPFGNGGTPRGPLDYQEGHVTMYRITEAIGGDLPKFWGTNLEWEIGLTYSYTKDLKEAEDILVDDMQAALNGFGGPNCTGTTPGQNGCLFFNPFSSAIARNAFTGATNPYYEPSLANSRELVDWLYRPIWFEREYKNYVVDPIIRGDIGIQLPGGPIAIAFGGQFRRQDERVTLDAISNRNNNPCTRLGVTDCHETAELGPWLYNRQGNVFGAAAHEYRPDARHYPVVAGFFETKLPVHSTLDINLAGRYEKFYSDVTDVDNDVFVPAVSFKWQSLDWLGLRAAWGKTFSQVNPPDDRDPILSQSAGSARYIGLGSGTRQNPDNPGDPTDLVPATYTVASYPNIDVKPERGEYFNVGFLFNAGNFSANVDYYDISISDYARTMTAANVVDALATEIPATGLPASAVAMNCNSPLLTQPINALGGRPFVELARPCVQGTTSMLDLAGGRVNYFPGNGQTNSGELKTNGIDISMRYRFDVGSGSITPSFDYSRVLKWELGDFVIGGVKVADGYDGLGQMNLGAGRIPTSVSKYRANASLLFNFGRHMLNIQAQYVPKIANDDETLFAASNNKNANIGVNGVTATGTNYSAAVPGSGSTCLVNGPITSDIGDVPADAGSGQWATGTVPTGQPGAGTRGFCGSQNTATLAGRIVEEWLNVDLIYRVQLPWETSATLAIQNVFDEDPSFYRGIVPYNSAYGSPLGRTFKLGVSKRF
jgi:iron complex outermembrane receptor protein